MAKALEKSVFALPGCQQISVNTLLCDTMGLAELKLIMIPPSAGAVALPAAKGALWLVQVVVHTWCERRVLCAFTAVTSLDPWDGESVTTSTMRSETISEIVREHFCNCSCNCIIFRKLFPRHPLMHDMGKVCPHLPCVPKLFPK